MLPIDKEKVKKILIIKLRGIGDVILSTVVLDNLRNDFPNAQIDFLTEKPSKNALENLPLINNILLFDRKSTAKRISQIFDIRQRKYDLILDFFSNPSTALITFFSGAKYRAGYPYEGRKYAYNLLGPKERDKFHAAQLHIEFLKQIGLSSYSSNLYFGLSATDKSFVNNYLAENISGNNLLVGISPSGGWNSKKCDPEKFAEIADNIVEKYNAEIIILWGPGDKDDTDKIHKLMEHKSIVAPDTDIKKMAAFLNACDFVVANDSGPMHICTAVNTPVLSLHGPTSPHLQGPFGAKHEWIRLDELECIECNLLECPKNHECFLDLPVEKIMAKIDSLVKKNNLLEHLNEKN